MDGDCHLLDFVLLQGGGEVAKIQAAAATLWVFYGVAIHSAPVVAATLIVGIAALYTSLRLVFKGGGTGTNP